jgi:hypothetical protein
MSILTYKISSNGVVDTGRPGNSPGFWSHDIIEHTLCPHPNRYIDEFLAIGSVIPSDDGDIRRVGNVVSLMYGEARRRDEIDRLCPEPAGVAVCPELAERVKNSLEASGMVEIPSYLPGNIASWVSRGAELFIERFPSNYPDINSELGKVIARAWWGWCEGEKFDELVIDGLKVYGVWGGGSKVKRYG